MNEIATDLGRAMNKSIEYCAQSMVDFETDFGATRAEFFEYPTNALDELWQGNLWKKGEDAMQKAAELEE